MVYAAQEILSRLKWNIQFIDSDDRCSFCLIPLPENRLQNSLRQYLTQGVKKCIELSILEKKFSRIFRNVLFYGEYWYSLQSHW